MRGLVRAVRSVRGRITLAATALVALTLIVASFAIVRLVENDLVRSAEAALDDALDQAAEVTGGLDNRRFPVEIDDAFFQLGVFTVEDDRFAFGTIYDDEDVPVAELVIDVDEFEVVEVFDPETGEELFDEELTEALNELVFDAAETEAEDGGTILVGATELTEVDASLDAVRRALLVIVPLLVLASGLLTWWLVGRALRPVHAITRRVEDISSSNLGQRVPTPDGDDEIADLATVMNDMLDRLQEGSERQRQFSADASHELRSPLAVVRAAAEMIERWPQGDRVESLAGDIVAESERMDALIGDLLELARVDEAASREAFETVDLGELVSAEVRDEGIEVRADGDSSGAVVVDGSKRMLRRVVRNLVDNARRHAEDRVIVVVEVGSDGTARVEVHDDGNGVPPAERDAVFERFTRLDEARSRDAGGAGLGLALVRVITERHHGTVTVDDSPLLGGAVFTVHLPRP